jgi:hypothetical protein
MQSTEISDRHPVFRFDDFAAAHAADGCRSWQTTAPVPKQRVAAGRTCGAASTRLCPEAPTPGAILSIPAYWAPNLPITA